MARIRTRSLFTLSLAGLCLSSLLPLSARAADPTPNKGAQVYCFMRSNGNNHVVSWEASYALIKRQSSGLFKTSPEHAAVMITEAVVADPGNYPDCGKYLGDLFGGNKNSSSSSSANSSSVGASSSGTSDGWDATERYSY